jgi:transposase
MIVIGVDTHKRTHTLAAVNASTGTVCGERTIVASDAGSLEALRFVRGLDEQRVWAIEDCRHVSGRIERALVAAGERVIRIPPAMTATSRRVQRRAGKSDPIDATAVALAALREGVERFPAAFLDEQAMEIRLVHDHRDQLIAERTRLINRLRWQLLAIDPELEARLQPRAFEQDRVRASVLRRLAKLGDGGRVRIARELLKRVSQITRQARELEAELKLLTSAHSPQLLAEPGCGPITAALLIGHTAGAERFATDSSFARHAGVAPIPASSGNTTRHRLHRGGDRQLNRALHTIALSRARNHPPTRAYLDRKVAEGKTKREALRCLKRHLARHFWKLLYTTDRTPSPPATTSRPALDVGAPALMLCTT